LSKWLYLRFDVQVDGLYRIAGGKYLKLLYEIHDKVDTLSTQPSGLCSKCGLGVKCPEECALTVYCLESVFLKKVALND
jgi:hypothetical protein